MASFVLRREPTLSDRTFTVQVQDARGLIYMNARYYDPAPGHCLSPDTLVPDATNLFDYNRYMYARGNPLKYRDPSGHCSTAAPDPEVDGAVEEFVACWQKAGTIMARYDSDAWWQETFRVSKEEWFKNIAMNSSIDSAWMQGQLESWYRAFTLRTGLPHPERRYEPHPPPKHPIELLPECGPWDCAAVAMDVGSLVLSGAGDVAWAACIAATEGACLAAGLLKAADVALTANSFMYSVDQYYVQHDASDADLAIALTDLLSVVPRHWRGVGNFVTRVGFI